MRTLRLAVTGTALLVVAGCADGRVAPVPTAPSLATEGSAAEPARQVDASGEFAAIIRPETFTFTPRGRNCLLTVDGSLVFTGDIEGAATGTTRALVFATCDDVRAAPPGTYPDVFRSELTFVGTVDGEPATANLLYMGRVAPGGAIEGRLVFSNARSDELFNGVSGRLDADAVVAVGGTYEGSVVVH